METEELKKLDMNTLVDMLARKTTDYMNLLKAGGPDDEFKKCKKLIQELTKEIQERQKQ